MRKFSSGLSHELILESKASLLKNNIEISRIVVFMQQVGDKKKNQAKIGKR